jgi:hypothetical protein
MGAGRADRDFWLLSAAHMAWMLLHPLCLRLRGFIERPSSCGEPKTPRRPPEGRSKGLVALDTGRHSDGAWDGSLRHPPRSSREWFSPFRDACPWTVPDDTMSGMLRRWQL